MPSTALPTDIEALHAVIAAQASELAAAKTGLVAKTLEVEKLKVQLARLRRLQFGRSSEKLARATEQLELILEEAEATAAAETPEASAPESDGAVTPEAKPRRGRRPLPAHLPRSEVVHDSACACPSCGGAMRKVGESLPSGLTRGTSPRSSTMFPAASR